MNLRPSRAQARPKYQASYTRQVAALSRRLSANCMRHPLLIGLNFGATFLMALGLGAIYWDSGRDTGGIQVGMRMRVPKLCCVWVGTCVCVCVCA